MSDPSDELDEEIAAYLDNELSPGEAESFEGRMASDPALRREVDARRATWDLLDLLPAPKPSANFASRTLSQIDAPSAPANASSSAVAGLAAPPKPRRVWPWAVAAMALGGPLGYALTPVANTDDDAAVFREMPILENLRLYQHADDLAFVEALDAPELFGQEP